MGYKSCHSSSSFCCELWGILARYSAWDDKSTRQVGGFPQAAAGHLTACKLSETPVWRTKETRQGQHRRNKVHHWVQGASISVHFIWHATDVNCHGSYPHCRLLDSSKHSGLRLTDCKPYRFETWVSHPWRPINLVQWVMIHCIYNYNSPSLHADFRYTASATEAWELSSLAHKVSNIHEHLKNQLAVCSQHIGWPLTFHFSLYIHRKKKKKTCYLIILQ